MGNAASTDDEDFSKTIDFCKQLRLLHFVVNEPKTFAECYAQFRGLITSGPDDGPPSDEDHDPGQAQGQGGGGGGGGTLRSQHRELDHRIGEIDFDQYRLMFSIRRILFSAPFRGSIIGYDLVPTDAGGKSRRVKYVISFDAHEHRPPPASSSSASSTLAYGTQEGGGVKSYRTKRSYSEFVQLDERIRNLFGTPEERREKRQLEEELDRRDRFMRHLDKSAGGAAATSTSSASSSSPSSSSAAASVDASASSQRRASLEEVKFEEDFWIYVKPKQQQQAHKRNSKEIGHGGGVEETQQWQEEEMAESEDKGKEKSGQEEEDDAEVGYDGLKLPPLPPKQFCWDDASRLAVAETRMPLLDAYLQSLFANAYLVNHEVFLRFLFSPDSFGDDLDEENAEVQRGVEKQKAGGDVHAVSEVKGAEAVSTPKTRQRSDYDGSAIVDDYETPSGDKNAQQSTTSSAGRTRQSSPRLPKLSGELVIIDDWEREEDGGEKDTAEAPPTPMLGDEDEKPRLEQQADRTTAIDVDRSSHRTAILQESVEQLFGTSPFFSLMDAGAPASSTPQPNDDMDQDKDAAPPSEQLPPRDVRDDWSFLCVELAVCKRRHSRRRSGDKKAGADARGEEERLETDDHETRRLLERTRTLDLKARTKLQQAMRARTAGRELVGAAGRRTVSCDGAATGLPRRQPPNSGGYVRGLSISSDGSMAEGNSELERKTATRERRLVAEDNYEAEDEVEERERQKRVMSRLQEAEEWVNRLDGGRRSKKQRRKWRVTSVESFVLSTGTGELPSVLRKCLEKQAKALMVAHGLASGKTGAIIASKKGAATLLQKSLAILGVTASREVNLMMAACLQLALSRVLLFMRLNSLEAYLSSRFFIHSSTYIGRVASMSAINSAQLIAKASILGALVAFLVEEIYLFVLFLRVWKVNGEKGLDLRQFIKSTVANLASNTSAYAGAIAGGTIGTMIEPGGGTIIGSLIGGIMCGILVSFGSDYVYSKYYGEEEEEEPAVEMEDLNRVLSVEEEMEAEDEQWEKLHLNVDLWEELVAEFEQLDGVEYETDTIDDIRREKPKATTEARTKKKESGGSGRKARDGQQATPLATKWGRVMNAARRRRRPSKSSTSTREGTRAQGESSQSPN